MQNTVAESAMDALTAEINKLYSSTKKNNNRQSSVIVDSGENTPLLQESLEMQQENIKNLESHSKHLEKLIEQLEAEKNDYQNQIESLQKKANRAEVLEQKVAKLKKKLEDNNIRMPGRQKGTLMKSGVHTETTQNEEPVE